MRKPTLRFVFNYGIRILISINTSILNRRNSSVVLLKLRLNYRLQLRAGGTISKRY